jgi:hypothetical protein
VQKTGSPPKQPEETQAWLVWNDYMECLLDRTKEAFVVIGTKYDAEAKAEKLTAESEANGMPEGYAPFYVVGPIPFSIAFRP